MVHFAEEPRSAGGSPVSRQAAAIIWDIGKNTPSFSVNVIMAGMILVSAALAPILDSWLATIATTVSLGGAVSMILSFYDIEVPWIHVIISMSSTVPLSGGSRHAQAHTHHELVASTPMSHKEFRLDELESSSPKSSIHESGYNMAREGPVRDSTFCVLFSESSRVLSQYAGAGDFPTCYYLLKGVAESIVQIWHSLPSAIGPPLDIGFVVPSGVDATSDRIHRMVVVPDDIDCVRSGWNLLRGKNSAKEAMKVLTSKLSRSITKWPIVCSIGVIKAPMEGVYKSIASSDFFRQVDEFAGEAQPVEYVELVDVLASPRAPPMLQPCVAPVFIKYQEMKSVWPVQPRDYLAVQTGFDVVIDGGTRRGKFIITKSIDPFPGDPFPDGQEGFVRGSLTASAFLIIENKTNKLYSDVWTFLHCDMKGNLSGNGKIADFITQSQMPKFFDKLEAVTVDHIRKLD